LPGGPISEATIFREIEQIRTADLTNLIANCHFGTNQSGMMATKEANPRKNGDLQRNDNSGEGTLGKRRNISQG
jgi:hypothetical protein